MENKAVITIKDAGFGYKKSDQPVQVLQNISHDFYPGDFIGIVGLNGTGKSTLIKTLCGLLPLLKGHILVHGASLENITVADLSKKISVVLTEKISGFNLTAFDVAAAGQMPYTNAFHNLNQENIATIYNAMKVCGVYAHKDKMVTELSDGLFQKAVISKALAQQTPVMLLDEPTAFLDYASKHELFILMKQLSKEEKKCILLSSHDLDLLLKYCNKLLVVSDGQTELIDVSTAVNCSAFLKITGGYL